MFGTGVGYENECTSIALNYTRSYTDSLGVRSVDQTFLLQLTLRTLGQEKVSTGAGVQTISDGLYR